MSPGLLGKLLVRELRGARGRLAPFLASLAIGVAAVVLVAGLGDSVSRAIRMEARPLLGGDVAARSFQPLPDEVATVAATVPGVRRVDSVDLLTMVAAPAGADGTPGRSLMAELKSVSPGWPFYGDPTLEPALPLAELLDPEGVVVEPALLERLGLSPGATVRIGSASFTARGVITKEPGRMPGGLSAGPRVLMGPEGLKRAGLGTTGARVTFRALFQAPDETSATQLATALKSTLGARATVETWTDAQPSTQRSIERSTAYMGLVALLSLIVGGVGVAQSTRAWMAQRLDALAVQRTLGLTARELGLVALLQTALLALLGSVAGAAIGIGALALTPRLLDGLLPAGAMVIWQPAAVARGIGLGLGVAMLFALRPLTQAVQVPPLRVLRRDVEPMPESPGQLLGAAALVGASLFGLALAQAQDPMLAAILTGGLGLVAGLGALGAAAVARGLGRLARGVRQWWLRHGLASVGRPGSGVVPAVVSLGIGVVVMLTTVLVEGRIFAQISSEFPKSAPSVFLVDVQPDQLAGVQATLAAADADRVRSAPMIVARLSAIDDVGVDALVAARGEDARWSLTREQRLSTMAALPADNTIVEGAPFSPAVANELSLEQRYAESLGAKLGSHVRFDVQGVPVDFVVTSIRTVSWESFDMNFFLVAEPGVLDAAPQTVLVTAQLPAEREAGVQDQLAATFPNVTLVSVRSALVQAKGLLTKLAWGIRAVGAFTALAGVTILVSGVAADATRQGRKVALLKTLGTTRAGVVTIFAIEYGLVGAMAGVLGAVGALGISYGVVTRMMHLDWHTDGVALAAAVGLSIGLTALVGVLANTRALRVRPAEVLRGE